MKLLTFNIAHVQIEAHLNEAILIFRSENLSKLIQKKTLILIIETLNNFKLKCLKNRRIFGLKYVELNNPKFEKIENFISFNTI